jgi:hypothetical protein
MSALTEFQKDLSLLYQNIGQYYKGNPDYPWSLIRVSLDNVDRSLTIAISELKELIAQIDTDNKTILGLALTIGDLRNRISDLEMTKG